MDTQEAKRNTRRAVTQLLAKCDPELLPRFAAQAARVLESSGILDGISLILLNEAFGTELPTDGMAKLAQTHGITVAWPRIKGGRMDFRIPRNAADWETHPYGLRQPTDSAPIADTARQGVLAIVPGLAFTLRGERLGRGKGYYDRFLSQAEHVHIVKIGYTTSLQILPFVPTSGNDVAMQYMLTEKGLIECEPPLHGGINTTIEVT